MRKLTKIFSLILCFSDFVKLLFLSAWDRWLFLPEDWKKLFVWSSNLFIVLTTLEMRKREVYRKQTISHVSVFYTLLTNTCSKSIVETLYWHVDCGQNQQQKHQPERCHAVFIFSFGHNQQINLFILIVNFRHVFFSWAQDKIHKKNLCKLNNRTVSLKHVATCNMKDVISLVTCLSQHGLNNP